MFKRPDIEVNSQLSLTGVTLKDLTLPPVEGYFLESSIAEGNFKEFFYKYGVHLARNFKIFG